MYNLYQKNWIIYFLIVPTSPIIIGTWLVLNLYFFL